jgi:hypothetical protein
MTGADAAIYLCTVDDIAGPGEDVQKQTTLLAKILEKLGYLLISDNEHRQLWAMRPEQLAQHSEAIATIDPEAPVYLCGMDELAGPGASEEHLMQRMGLLMHVLKQVGWALASGVVPNFHELWAVPPEPAGLGDNGRT